MGFRCALHDDLDYREIAVNARKRILGKLFVSHASKDKPFVRRLAQRLWKEGYQVWLDEKELVPGDALAARLSQALEESRVVLVVVTQNSIKSKWLAFELNKATERMVEGRCRVIPVLRGDVEPPATLKGLIYADFRKSFIQGFKELQTGLRKEVDEALSGSWRQLQSLAEDTFDSHGFVSILGGYKSLDYDYVEIDGVQNPFQPDDNAPIVLDVVHAYGDKDTPLGERWWDEYRAAQERFAETYHLVVTERPIALSELHDSKRSSRVRVCVEPNSKSISFVVVFADVSGLAGVNDRACVLQDAKAELKRIGSLLEREALPNDVPIACHDRLDVRAVS